MKKSTWIIGILTLAVPTTIFLSCEKQNEDLAPKNKDVSINSTTDSPVYHDLTIISLPRGAKAGTGAIYLGGSGKIWCSMGEGSKLIVTDPDGTDRNASFTIPNSSQSKTYSVYIKTYYPDIPRQIITIDKDRYYSDVNEITIKPGSPVNVSKQLLYYNKASLFSNKYQLDFWETGPNGTKICRIRLYEKTISSITSISE